MREPSRSGRSERPPPRAWATRDRSRSSFRQHPIEPYTFEDELVLDPFMGSGTTAMAAQRRRRHYVGYDTSPEYLQLAHKRLDAEPHPYDDG